MQKQVTITTTSAHGLQVSDVVHIGGISHWEGTIAPTYSNPPNAVQRFGMAQAAAQARPRDFSPWFMAVGIVGLLVLLFCFGAKN